VLGRISQFYVVKAMNTGSSGDLLNLAFSVAGCKSPVPCARNDAYDRGRCLSAFCAGGSESMVAFKSACAFPYYGIGAIGVPLRGESAKVTQPNSTDLK